jgi:hypothetical protein
MSKACKIQVIALPKLRENRSIISFDKSADLVEQQTIESPDGEFKTEDDL